ncbi:MAG: hypothetical protein IPM13_01220 [Phycisphaerales bacterium]|nr:hypothetical protein [Phycisphaerales bacterium]
MGDPNLPAAETTRTLPTGVPAGTGGKANEYGRVQLVAAGQPIDHELVCDAAGNLVRVDVVGDLNCDGEVTFDDLDAFMLALTDPSGYAQAHPDCRLLLGDVDGDGQLTFDDIDYWVALIGVSAVAADRYEYDHENRLTAVRGPGGVLKLRIWYDALGRRILSETYDASGDPVTTTRHIYDGLAAIVEFEDENGAPADWTLAREFIWGDRFPEPLVLIDHTGAGDVPAGQPEHLYFVHDALGSAVGLTNDPAALAALDPNYPGGGGSGGGVGGTTGILPALVERYDYDPYGATYIACRMPSTYDEASETRDPHLLTDSAAWQPCELSRFDNPLLWTAQRYDPGVRLYHFLVRTYSPTLGRWIQRDPIASPQRFASYEYAISSPLGLIDPDGRDPTSQPCSPPSLFSTPLGPIGPAIPAILIAILIVNTERSQEPEEGGVKDFGHAWADVSDLWGFRSEGHYPIPPVNPDTDVRLTVDPNAPPNDRQRLDVDKSGGNRPDGSHEKDRSAGFAIRQEQATLVRRMMDEWGSRNWRLSSGNCTSMVIDILIAIGRLKDEQRDKFRTCIPPEVSGGARVCFDDPHLLQEYLEKQWSDVQAGISGWRSGCRE